MSGESELQITGLTEIDLLELEEELGDVQLRRLPRNAVAGSGHGDLGLTAAAVVLTAAAVHGLSVWLAKRRVTDIRSSGLEFVKSADGTITLKIAHTSQGTLSDMPDSKVVEALKTEVNDVLSALKVT